MSNIFKKFIESVKKEIPKDPKLIKREIKSYIIITCCFCLYAFSLVTFIIQSGIVGGGVAGISTLTYYATNHTIPVSITSFVINIVLLIIGFKVLGPQFGLKTVYATFMMSAFIGMWEGIIISRDIHILEIDPFLSAVIGGVLIGIAIGFSFRYGGSTGGTDIIALIIAKYRNIGPGRVIMIMDVVIIGSSFFVFRYGQGSGFEEAIRIVLYGYVTLFVYSYVIDMVVVGGNASVQVMVNSSKYKEIAEMITHEQHRGVTMLRGEKYYTQTETQVLWIVVRKYELQQTLRRIRDIDPNVFMSITKTSGVYGQGFEKVK